MLTEKNNIDLIRGFEPNQKSNSYFKVGYRKDLFLNTPIFVGRKRNVVFSNNDVRTGYFAIVELNSIIASHNEETFGSTKNYPTDETGRNVNDRNYSGDKNAQAKVISVAQNLDPNIIISTSATASGTPIISIDGVVVSGNNRTMSLKIAAAQFKDIYKQYVNVLMSEISLGGYGINLNEIQTMDKPVLVRFDMGFNEYTTSELNKYNKVRSKSEKPIDTAIRLSRQLGDNSNCQNQLISLVSDQEVVSDLYNDKDAVSRFRKILLDCNIITENEISNLFSGNTLTNAGKLLYETILLSMVLETNAIEISQNDGVKSATRSIVNAIIPLVKNKKLGEGSLIQNVNNALVIQNEMVSRGITDLYDYVTQGNLFETNPLLNEKTVIINWFLNQTVNLLKTTLSKYNNSIESNQGENIFGDNLSAEEIFNSVFAQAVDKKLLSVFIKKGNEDKVVTLTSESETLKDRIKNLQMAKKYQDNNGQKEVDDLINKLELVLKYL